MKIAIVKETEELEKRVAATPETVKKLLSLGYSVDVEEGAGVNSFTSKVGIGTDNPADELEVHGATAAI